ncbi:MAG TPA: SMP-30/gluconolactonase/LRE family protein [Verrucomicrobiae bacterium]|nr:SMP-30/gluconolactonase/LRE family protein [Verrucomicrobiae bacterium]
MDPLISMDAFEIFATGVDHPECIAFDRNGDLWAGGEIGQVYRIAPDGKVRLITTIGGFCAGLAFSPADELFVCNSQHGIVRVNAGGSFEIFASCAGKHKLVCPNYGLFDSAGNYYVTDSGQFRKRNGCLIRFTPDGEGQVLTGPLGYANGLALSADEKTLLMVESDTNSVFRFEIRADGSVGPHSVYAAECGRFPDGLTLDADGNLYICCYASDEIWRIAPSGVKELFAWDPWAVRLGSPTNMAFGGKDFDELYFANLARTTITRVKTGCKGQPLANQKTATREQASK